MRSRGQRSRSGAEEDCTVWPLCGRPGRQPVSPSVSLFVHLLAVSLSRLFAMSPPGPPWFVSPLARSLQPTVPRGIITMTQCTLRLKCSLSELVMIMRLPLFAGAGPSGAKRGEAGRPRRCAGRARHHAPPRHPSSRRRATVSFKNFSLISPTCARFMGSGENRSAGRAPVPCSAPPRQCTATATFVARTYYSFPSS